MPNYPIRPASHQIFQPEQSAFRALPQPPEQDKMTKLMQLFRGLFGGQPERMGRMGSY